MAFIYNLTDNWTSNLTTWNGIKLAVTDSGSSASSDLLNLSISGLTTASFIVDKNANLTTTGTINKLTLTEPATGAVLAMADNSQLNTIGPYVASFTFTDVTSVTFPTSGLIATTSDKLSVFAPTSSSELANVITDETGTGDLVFANTPTLVTPILGTPTSGTLTNCTDLPISTGVSGLGTGVATFLATPSSANLRGAVTDETGTGNLVFSNSPTFDDDITLGTQQTTQGALVLANTAAGAYATTIKASNLATAAWTLTLPTTGGTNGYVLSTDGNGTTSWVVQSGGGGGGGTPGGSDTQIQFNDAGAFGGNAAFTFDKALYLATIGVASTTTGKWRFANSASANYVTVQAGNTSANWTLTLPTTAGTANYFLTTDGSGASSWSKVDLGTSTSGTLPVSQGGTGTGTAFTSGSVVFAGASGTYSQNNSKLYWDNTNYRVGINTATPAVSLAISATDAILMPVGTTAQRPTGATGYIRYNTTLSSFEGYNGSAWGSIGGGATGGGSNQAFYLNDQLITDNYTIAATKNAGTFGPISIDSGVTVTVSSGATWTVV
jgi:hypothetical protein